MNYSALKEEYSNLLETMEVKSDWTSAVDRKARSIYANKYRYMEVSKDTGVPWNVIGLIHSLEANLDFTCNLHNGEPLNRKTRLVPRGRGPFSSWEEAAVDALKYDGLDKIEDWSDEMVCYALEKYNGFGYRSRRTGVLSPYLWSGTNHYKTGKFIENEKGSRFVRSAKSQQIGAIPLYLRLKEIDIPNKKIVSLSSKLTWMKRLRTWITGGGLSAAGAEALGYLETVKEFVATHALWFVAGTGVFAFLVFKYFESKSVNDYKEGRYVPSKQGDSE